MGSRRNLYAMAGTCVPSIAAVAKSGRGPPIVRSEGRLLPRAPSAPPPLSCVHGRTIARILPGAAPPGGPTSRGAAGESGSPNASTPPPPLLAAPCPYHSGIPRAPRTRGRLEAPSEPLLEGYRPVLPGTRKSRGAWDTRRRWLHRSSPHSAPADGLYRP